MKTLMMILALLLITTGCTTERIVYRQIPATIPDNYFAHCKLAPVRKGATNYGELVDMLSESYFITAREVAKCNARLDLGKKLQKDIVDNFSD